MTPGTILAGKYRLVSMLGHGGMGSVWRAERLGWEAPVAVKMMHLPGAHDPSLVARFQREARLGASLRSLHIAQVLDDGVDAATGTPFIVMELLEGESLAERLLRVRRLRPPVVAQIISQIARALARAHAAGLIHRDLKPDNILIVRNDDEEVIKVLDFGIAKWMASPLEHGPRTISGQMLGTPVYMSPEQFVSSAQIDHRADLWSLGVIAFECLTGVRPFQADTLVTLALQVCSGNAPAPSGLGPVPDGFDSWFRRAIARDPERRFPSARLMAEELRGLCGHTPLLWESAATAPPQHLPREKTELDPVLELRRLSRPNESQVPHTDLGSVMPAVRSSPAPAKRRPRLWFGVVSLLMAVLGFGSVILLLEGSNSSVNPLASGLRQGTRELHEALARRSGDGSTPASATATAASVPPVSTLPAGSATAPRVSTLPAGSARSVPSPGVPAALQARAAEPRDAGAGDAATSGSGASP